MAATSKKAGAAGGGTKFVKVRNREYLFGRGGIHIILGGLERRLQEETSRRVRYDPSHQDQQRERE